MSGGSEASSLTCGVVGVRDDAPVDRASEIEPQPLARDKSFDAAKRRREQDARNKREKRARAAAGIVEVVVPKKKMSAAERYRANRDSMTIAQRMVYRKKDAASHRARYTSTYVRDDILSKLEPVAHGLAKEEAWSLYKYIRSTFPKEESGVPDDHEETTAAAADVVMTEPSRAKSLRIGARPANAVVWGPVSVMTEPVKKTRDAPAKVLKDRRSPRERGRMGTSVDVPAAFATAAADACQHQNVLAPVKMEAGYDNYDKQQKESQSQSKDGLVARSDVGSLAPATLEPGSVLMTAETYCALLIRRGFTPLVSGERCPRVEGIAATV